MNKEQALDSFWNTFGVSAYDEGTVPDDATLPYITYSVSTDDFNHPVSLTASIWNRSTSWERVTEILENISEVIGHGGQMVAYDRGAFWITKGSPFSQRVPDEDDSIRRILINVEVEFIS